MGVWDGILDLNGIDKLQAGEPGDPQLASDVNRIALGNIPVCGMNTAFAAELTPAYFFLPDLWVNGWQLSRHDDIWGGYLVKKLMDRRGDLFAFGHPVVEHTKQTRLERVVVLEQWMHLMSMGFYDIVDAAAAEVAVGDYTEMFAEFVDEYDRQVARLDAAGALRHRLPRAGRVDAALVEGVHVMSAAPLRPPNRRRSRRRASVTRSRATWPRSPRSRRRPGPRSPPPSTCSALPGHVGGDRVPHRQHAAPPWPHAAVAHLLLHEHRAVRRELHCAARRPARPRAPPPERRRRSAAACASACACKLMRGIRHGRPRQPQAARACRCIGDDVWLLDSAKVLGPVDDRRPLDDRRQRRRWPTTCRPDMFVFGARKKSTEMRPLAEMGIGAEAEREQGYGIAATQRAAARRRPADGAGPTRPATHRPADGSTGRQGPTSANGSVNGSASNGNGG